MTFHLRFRATLTTSWLHQLSIWVLRKLVYCLMRRRNAFFIIIIILRRRFQVRFDFFQFRFFILLIFVLKLWVMIYMRSNHFKMRIFKKWSFTLNRTFPFIRNLIKIKFIKLLFKRFILRYMFLFALNKMIILNFRLFHFLILSLICYVFRVV